MRELDSDELDMISGGAVVAPTCTTSGSTTTCSCPSGSTPMSGQQGNTVLISCHVNSN